MFGPGDRNGLRLCQSTREQVDVFGGEVAAFPADDERGAPNGVPLRPVVARDEIGDALDHHLFVEAGPQPIAAELEAGGPRIGCEPLGAEEASG